MEQRHRLRERRQRISERVVLGGETQVSGLAPHDSGSWGPSRLAPASHSAGFGAPAGGDLQRGGVQRSQPAGLPRTPFPSQAHGANGGGKEPLPITGGTDSRVPAAHSSPKALPWTPMQRTYDSLRPKLQLSGLKRGRPQEAEMGVDEEAGLDTVERRIRRRGDVAIGSAERRIWKVRPPGDGVFRRFRYAWGRICIKGLVHKQRRRHNIWQKPEAQVDLATAGDALRPCGASTLCFWGTNAAVRGSLGFFPLLGFGPDRIVPRSLVRFLFCKDQFQISEL
eukprot:jgi/Botrbrau1/8668/Bobra.0087s0021.1